MIGLLFKKNTLLVLGVIGLFTYPMIRDGELSVGKILGAFAGENQDQQAATYDPYLNPYDSNATFRPASIGNASSSLLPGTNPNSQVGFSAAPASTITPTEKGQSISDQISGFLGTMFETQTVDASGQSIPQPNSTPATQTRGQNHPVGQQASYRPPAQPENLPINDVREIIRFDVSPFWVQQRWPRVSAAPVSEEGFQGLRVPLTSGPGPIEMNGALTYYFDEKQVVQRIQFQGTTNQPAVLQQLCQNYFNFQAIPDMPGVMAPVHDSQPCGLLKLSVPVVIDRTRPMAQSQVAMEINSTKGPYKLSQMMRFIAVQR